MMIISKLICILFIIVLVILSWKTTEYFNRLPENAESRPLIAWDVLMLICMLSFMVFRLIRA